MVLYRLGVLDAHLSKHMNALDSHVVQSLKKTFDLSGKHLAVQYYLHHLDVGKTVSSQVLWSRVMALMDVFLSHGLQVRLIACR
jgi:hypothetical protein